MPGVTEQEIAQAKQMNLYQYRQQLVRERDRPATALHIATAGNATREL